MQFVGKACPSGMSRPDWWCKDDYVTRNIIYEVPVPTQFDILNPKVVTTCVL